MTHGNNLQAHGGALSHTGAASGLAGPCQGADGGAGSLRIGAMEWPTRCGTRRTWPGKEYGIRGPEPDETALSWAEVDVALAEIWQKPALSLVPPSGVAMDSVA